MGVDIKFSQFCELGLNEDAPANVSGGTGVGSPSPTMANIDKPLSMVKRGKFAGKDYFDVDGECYSKCVHGKRKFQRYEKYVGNDETGEAIRQFGRENPKSSILVRHKDTGAMMYLRRVNEKIEYDYVELDPNMVIGDVLSASREEWFKYAGKRISSFLAKFKDQRVDVSKANKPNEYVLELPKGEFLEFSAR